MEVLRINTNAAESALMVIRPVLVKSGSTNNGNQLPTASETKMRPLSKSHFLAKKSPYMETSSTVLVLLTLYHGPQVRGINLPREELHGRSAACSEVNLGVVDRRLANSDTERS